MKNLSPLLIPALVSGICILPVMSMPEDMRLIKPLTKKTKSSKKRYVELPPWGYVPKKVSKKSKRGKRLYKKENCAQCHSINGKGGELGPPLDGIGGHRGPEWLLDRLLDPEKQTKQFAHVFGNKPNIMPHPAVSKKDASSIVEYILTLPEPEEGYLVATHSVKPRKSKRKFRKKAKAQDKESALRGAKIFYEKRCYSCHSLDGSRDRFGPDLAGLQDRISEKKLKKFLLRPYKSGFMKAQLKDMPKEDREDLKAFLLTIPKVEKAE